MTTQGRRLAVAVHELLVQRTHEREAIPEVAQDDRLVLNVGGVRHETLISSLLRKPCTRLYHVARVAQRTGIREVYFDRNPELFTYVLNYYRTDALHMPTNVCGPMLQAELAFWHLDEQDVAECCWVAYNSYADTMSMLAKFEADDSMKYRPTCNSEPRSRLQTLKPRVWNWLQNPYSSTGAKVYAFMSLVVVCISITVFVIETLPYFDAIFSRYTNGNGNITITNEVLRRELDILNNISPYHILLMIDNTCNLFFLSEFLVKLFAAPSRARYMALPLSVIELLALIPYYLATAIVFLHPDPASCFRFIQVLLAFRLVRIFRIFALMKHFLALKILVYTMIASAKELFLVVLIVLIGLIIFACLEYYMELLAGAESDFEHIPLAFWWALITMTTVGYGDMVPRSGLGLVVGGLCAISGVLVIALSVPVIVNNFTLYYTHAQSRAKLRERRKQHSLVKHWQSLTKTLAPGPKKKVAGRRGAPPGPPDNRSSSDDTSAEETTGATASQDPDKADRGDRDRGDRADRRDTGDRADKADRADRRDTGDRADKADRTDRSESCEVTTERKTLHAMCRLVVESSTGGDHSEQSDDEETAGSLHCSLGSSTSRLLALPKGQLCRSETRSISAISFSEASNSRATCACASARSADAEREDPRGSSPWTKGGVDCDQEDRGLSRTTSSVPTGVSEANTVFSFPLPNGCLRHTNSSPSRGSQESRPPGSPPPDDSGASRRAETAGSDGDSSKRAGSRAESNHGDSNGVVPGTGDTASGAGEPRSQKAGGGRCKSWLKLPPLSMVKNDARPPLASPSGHFRSPQFKFRSRVGPAPATASEKFLSNLG